ncbi:LysM repeat protein [Flavobacterium arsenatis]|uniref:LysM repeat protein n=1 Tax=Flavobacterium arsenatis TaxID=1484332 RepID=A0ABU1TL89_9FLAO|nr:LysM peptidoglycan-binding domain-containing protein [Flavobacterium arsenatis]MDR6966735.1 LysM repeat protein [Flavobacterium arsenatis]
MKKYYILFLLLFRSGIFEIYAQETFLKHKVVAEETIEFIAKKYQVSTTELYQLNPSLSNGFKENDVILIPKTKIWNIKDNDSDTISHLVQPRETKFGLSKKYNISIEELERQNPHIIDMLRAGAELKIQVKAVKNNNDSRSTSEKSNQNGDYTAYLVQPGETLWGIARRYKTTVSELIEINRSVLGAVLQSGQTISVPAKKSDHIPVSDSNYEQYIVEAGETKYGLSKRFGVSINELENLNPHIIKMLRTGHQINIPGRMVDKPIAKQQVDKPKSIAVEKEVLAEKPAERKETIAKSETVSTKADAEKSVEKKEIITQAEVKIPIENLVSYEVQPKETLYGLSKMSGLSEEKLIDLNPELSNGLKAGMIIKVPTENASALTNAKATLFDNSQAGLLKSIKKGEQKEIAFLMPFTEEKYLDFIKSSPKTDETTAQLEFYAGASMAMDSLRKNNVLISSKVFEIQYSGTAEEGFSNLISNNIQNYKAVFCPMEASGSEKLGDYLSKNNIPMIFSDTKKTAATFATTYNALISDVQLKKLVLDYVVSKKQNTIIVSDPTRKESRDFIAQNYPEARFVKIDENGVFDSESLKSLLSSSNKSYVVLDTDKAGLILTATTSLLKYSKEFDVEIALVELKEKIKGEGLSEMRFKALKMIYPSLYKPTNTKELEKFKKDFLVKYGFEPTNEAVKGFDVTFDALLRLFQDRSFEVLAQESRTEQLKLSFRYSKDPDGGYINSGAYILQYTEDTDAKIVK